MSPVTIRSAIEDDLPVIADAARDLYDLHHRLDPQRFWNLGGDGPARREGRLRYFRSLLTANEGGLIVAEQDGEVVGHAFYTLERHDYMNLLESALWLHDLHVAPRARRRGVGEALFEALCRLGREADLPRMVLSVAERNAEAQAFFERMGARTTQRERMKVLGQPTERGLSS